MKPLLAPLLLLALSALADDGTDRLPVSSPEAAVSVSSETADSSAQDTNTNSISSEQITEEAVAEEQLDDHLLELTKVKLRKARSVLEKIEQAGGEDMLPLFKTMLAGDLYYVKKTRKLVGKQDIDGET
ncbi:MAG: hypothetical protein ACPGYX_07915, partial [Oceanobacter sp.]